MPTPAPGELAAGLFHREFTEVNRDVPAEDTLESPLLALHHSSDVNPLTAEQIRAARAVLDRRRHLLAQRPGGLTAADSAALAELQRVVVEGFLAGRRGYFAADQCVPFPEAEQMAAEGRDVFLVVKFMDEAPHLEATMWSLLNQCGIAPSRIVIVAVDNNSTDGSAEIVKSVAAQYRGGVRIMYVRQEMPGAGNAARLGVDRSIATIVQMCRLDGRWDRLQDTIIGVSDGDTVYSPYLLRDNLALFRESPDVDGVMPFLTYKLVAALRLFPGYPTVHPARLGAAVPEGRAVPVTVDLSTVEALEQFPRPGRRQVADAMQLRRRDGDVLRVPLDFRDETGLRFGALRDPAGRLAFVLEDRRIVVAQAPVSGLDEPLVALENGTVARDAKWRWHALVGHDLFLQWAFAGMGLPEEMIFPDTSDALKLVRAWSLAVGGQHQLRRNDLRIATGSDYQSGRVLQETGAVVRLGPAHATAETEIDRLLKMVRNLVHSQGVFYGHTRSMGLERATGLYVHMTRIQPALEAEVRRYDDAVFEKTIFPERVLFPLRWILQNAVRWYAHHDPRPAHVVRERVLRNVFTPAEAERIESTWFSESIVADIRRVPLHAKQDVAERAAEGIIAEHYPALMRFYGRTLEDFLDYQQIPRERYDWLLEGLPESRNAMTEPPPPVHPSVVWEGSEFEIDVARGQVVRMRTGEEDTA